MRPANVSGKKKGARRGIGDGLASEREALTDVEIPRRLGGSLIHGDRRAQGDDLLDRLGEEFAARLRRGEQPALQDYADRYPELAEEIRELFPALANVEQVKEICRAWDDAERRVTPLSQVGDFRIIRGDRPVGRGRLRLRGTRRLQPRRASRFRRIRRYA